MNFERLAESEPRRCFGDMVSSSLIAGLRFADGRFIFVPTGQALGTALPPLNLINVALTEGSCSNARNRWTGGR